MKRIYRNALVLAGALVAGSLVLFGPLMSLSVLIGAALSLLNLRWMTRGVDQALKPGGASRAGSAVFWYMARLVLISLAFFAMIRSSFLDVLGALTGFSAFVLAGLLEAVLLLWKTDNGTR